MTSPPLDPDTLLTTTRTVRKRLDLERPVPDELIDECLRIAQQAPSGGNRQKAAFVVVRDQGLRNELARIYRAGWEHYRAHGVGSGPPTRVDDPSKVAAQKRIADSALYLAHNLERVPVHVIPCISPRTDDASVVVQASTYGSVLPAAWSFMLAARARGLATAWTTVHLVHEREAAQLLGIPDDYMQVALIPTAYLRGDQMKPGSRRPLDEFRMWDGWTA